MDGSRTLSQLFTAMRRNALEVQSIGFSDGKLCSKKREPETRRKISYLDEAKEELFSHLREMQ